MNPASILCIVDFSVASKEVMKCAIGMAEKNKVPVTILHPYRLNQVERNEDMVTVKRKLDQDALENFKILSDGLFKNKKISFDFRAEVGFVQDRIEDYARKHKILFLVIGFDHASRDKEVMEGVLKETEAPLVIVPAIHK
jgi:hypothetical protein